MMRFRFPIQQTEIQAPVLENRSMGYVILRKGRPCVFLARLLNELRPPGPEASSQPQSLQGFHDNDALQQNQHQHLQPQQQPQQLLNHQQQQRQAHYQQQRQHMPQQPALVAGEEYGAPYRPAVADQGQRRIYAPPSSGEEDPFAPRVETFTLPPNTTIEPVVANRLPPLPAPAATVTSAATAASPSGAANIVPPSMPTLTDTASPTVNSPLTTPPTRREKKISETSEKEGSPPSTDTKQEEEASSSEKTPPSPPLAASAPSGPVHPSQVSNLYSALKPHELDRLLVCRFCHKRVDFASELLVHLKKHTQDVDSVAESLSVWTGGAGRKLRCGRCKNKSSYSLTYAKHIDSHVIPAGLQCPICSCCDEDTASPAKFSLHMEIHHPSVIFAEGKRVAESTQQQPQHQQQDLTASSEHGDTTKENTSNKSNASSSNGESTSSEQKEESPSHRRAQGQVQLSPPPPQVTAAAAPLAEPLSVATTGPYSGAAAMSSMPSLDSPAPRRPLQSGGEGLLNAAPPCVQAQAMRSPISNAHSSQISAQSSISSQQQHQQGSSPMRQLQRPVPSPLHAPASPVGGQQQLAVPSSPMTSQQQMVPSSPMAHHSHNPVPSSPMTPQSQQPVPSPMTPLQPAPSPMMSQHQVPSSPMTPQQLQSPMTPQHLQSPMTPQQLQSPMTPQQLQSPAGPSQQMQSPMTSQQQHLQSPRTPQQQMHSPMTPQHIHSPMTPQHPPPFPPPLLPPPSGASAPGTSSGSASTESSSRTLEKDFFPAEDIDEEELEDVNVRRLKLLHFIFWMNDYVSKRFLFLNRRY